MRCVLVIALVVSASTPAIAQSVVQLPAVHTFSMSGSVLVPDSGGAYLGGVGRASQGRTSQGWGPLGRNSSGSGAVMGSGVMVHATIIDHAELDASVLDEARVAREAAGVEAGGDGSVGSPVRHEKVTSLGAIRNLHAAEDSAQEAAARRAYEKALAYEQDHDYALARNYYRIAILKSAGGVKEIAAARLRGLPQPAKRR